MTVQIRTYTKLSAYFEKKQAHAVATFVIQPQELIQGNSAMRAIGRGNFLRGCVGCHSGTGIHSVNSHNENFSFFRLRVKSLLPPQIKEIRLAEMGMSTAREKKKHYTWGLLEGLWQN